MSGGALSVWLFAVAPGFSAEASAPRIGHAARKGVLAQPLSRLRADPPQPSSARVRADSVRQTKASPAAPAEILQFDGATNNDNLLFFPKADFSLPDANGAAGPDHYFQAINIVFRIFDKSGNLVLGPLPNASLWTGLGGFCESANANTPLVKYDTLAGRWLVSQVGIDFSEDPATTHLCIAASTSADPAGTYNQYDFVLAPGSIATSLRIGVWPEAYYATVNQFVGLADAGFGIYALDRNAILAGGAAAYQYADAGATHPSTLWALPADLDGSTPPPDGAPNVAIALGAGFLDGSPNDLVHVWRFHADFADPGNTTFDGPVDVAIAPFTPLDCGAPSEGCVPQLDSTQLLQASPSRLMYRLAYRNFGDHESLVTNFTVDGAPFQNRAAVRWLEIRDPNGSPQIFQEGTYVPDASHRFVGSIAMDRNGDAALGYTKSDATIHPTLAVTGRLAGDPAGTMGSENAFFEGPRSRPPVVGFWGIYSSMALDPTDDCTFWFTSEYIGEPAPFFEYTRIGSFKFPSCTSGPTGALQGTVTEADSGLPLAGARVTAGASETVTDAAGHYQFLALPVGAYDMTVTKFGIIPGAASAVPVTEGGTTTQDFVLGLAPTALLNVVVRDGSGAGWPLYAKVRITGPPEFTPAEPFTDPVTGYFGITLVTGVTYTLSTEAVLPGYQADVRALLLEAATSQRPDVVEHIELSIDATLCSAPGYTLDAEGLTERFDAPTLPPGWSVVNNAGGLGWSIHEGPDPCGVFDGNETGGDGPFALVNSHCEGEVSQDTELMTPAVDLTALSSVQIRFDQDFQRSGGELADVDVSIDGGTSWTNVLSQTETAAGPNSQSIDISSLAAGQADVRARFHYHNAFAALWWQVDDVALGETHCVAGEGGLVVGNVFDANTGEGLNGAFVDEGFGGGPRAITFATPDDPAQPDGLYVLFSQSGPRTLSASMVLYGGEPQTLTVVPNSAQRLDFRLPAGSLQASPSSLTARVDPGGTESLTLTFANDGALEAVYGILELYVPPLPATPPGGGSADPALRARALARLARPELANASSAQGLGPLPGGPPAARLIQGAGEVLNAYPTGLEAAWGIAFDSDYENLWISNSFLFAGDNREYEYGIDGTPTGETIDDSSWIADWAADGAYDPRRQRLWRINVGGDGCVYEIDQGTFTVSGNRICPAFGTSQRGLAYDPITDTFYSGSWNDGVIQHFDATGAILDSAYVAIPISGLAFDPSTGRLYALANHDVLLGYDVYVLDTHNHYAVVGAFFVTSGGSPVLSPNGQAGMELGCDGHLWLIDSTTQTLYDVDAGASGACDVLEIPWVFEEPHAYNVPPHSSQAVLCAFNSAGLTPGMRQGILRVITNTPYAVSPIPISLTVRFLDVADGSLFDPFIYAAAGAGVMPGCDPAAFLFCPTDLVTRADMAGFILRAVHGADFVPAPYAGAFSDVSAGDDNADYIQSFFDEGYTAGCGGGNYCPEAVHTRGQTAVFILKGVHGTSYVPPPCGETHVFDDVPCPPTPEAPFGDWIGQLFVEGITAGCGGNSFCPTAGTPNQQMAAFLVRAFAIPHP